MRAGLGEAQTPKVAGSPIFKGHAIAVEFIAERATGDTLLFGTAVRDWVSRTSFGGANFMRNVCTSNIS